MYNVLIAPSDLKKLSNGVELSQRTTYKILLLNYREPENSSLLR